MSRISTAVLLLPLATGACATLFTPHSPPLPIRTDPPGATVLDSAGKALGTTPFRLPLRVHSTQTLRIAAPGFDTATVTLRRRPKAVMLLNGPNPLAWGVDMATLSGWEHDPRAIDVALTPSPTLDDAAVAAVLTAFADAARRAGCDTLLLGAWRDAALELEGGGADAVPDSIRRFANEEAGRVAPELRALCAQRTPRLERLREIGSALGAFSAVDPRASDVEGLAPVFFEPDRWEVGPDSVRRRLRDTARRLAERGFPVRLVVEGSTDATGSEAANRELAWSRANAVIAELVRGGLPRDCCVAVARPASPAMGATPPRPDSPEARLARSVTFSLDYREAAP